MAIVEGWLGGERGKSPEGKAMPSDYGMLAVWVAEWSVGVWESLQRAGVDC